MEEKHLRASLLLLFLLLSSSPTLSSPPPSHRICVIGSGIAGSSLSHFLKTYSPNPSSLQITIFERNRIVGGRTATVTIAGDTFEAGASIIHPKNLRALKFTSLLNLSIKTQSNKSDSSSWFGIWDGSRFVFKTLQPPNPKSGPPFYAKIVSFLNSLLVFGRYGFSLLRMERFVDKTVGNFLRYYENLESRPIFSTVEEMLKWADLYGLTRRTLQEELADAGLSQRLISELVTGAQKSLLLWKRFQDRSKRCLVLENRNKSLEDELQKMSENWNELAASLDTANEDKLRLQLEAEAEKARVAELEASLQKQQADFEARLEAEVGETAEMRRLKEAAEAKIEDKCDKVAELATTHYKSQLASIRDKAWTKGWIAALREASVPDDHPGLLNPLDYPTRSRTSSSAAAAAPEGPSSAPPRE